MAGAGGAPGSEEAGGVRVEQDTQGLVFPDPGEK